MSDGLEEIVRSIKADNEQFREASNTRISKLLSVMQNGTRDEFSTTVNSLLDEVTDGEGDEILGQDGRPESDVGSDGDAET